jgi:hypothetical protein
MVTQLTYLYSFTLLNQFFLNWFSFSFYAFAFFQLGLHSILSFTLIAYFLYYRNQVKFNINWNWNYFLLSYFLTIFYCIYSRLFFMLLYYHNVLKCKCENHFAWLTARKYYFELVSMVWLHQHLYFIYMTK